MRAVATIEPRTDREVVSVYLRGRLVATRKTRDHGRVVFVRRLLPADSPDEEVEARYSFHEKATAPVGYPAGRWRVTHTADVTRGRGTLEEQVVLAPPRTGTGWRIADSSEWTLLAPWEEELLLHRLGETGGVAYRVGHVVEVEVTEEETGARPTLTLRILGGDRTRTVVRAASAETVAAALQGLRTGIALGTFTARNAS